MSLRDFAAILIMPLFALSLSGCSPNGNNATSTALTSVSSAVQTSFSSSDKEFAAEFENVQIHDYMVDILKRCEMPDSLTGYDSIQIEYPDEPVTTLYTISKSERRSNHADPDMEHDSKYNTAQSKLDSGRGEQVDVDGHLGCLEKGVSGAGDKASYHYTLTWMVGNCDYYFCFTFDGEKADQLKGYAETFYQTIKTVD